MGILLGQGVSREGVPRAIKQVELFQGFDKGREANWFSGWMLNWGTLGLACLDQVFQRILDRWYWGGDKPALKYQSVQIKFNFEASPASLRILSYPDQGEGRNQL